MRPAPQAQFLLFASGAEWYAIPSDRAAEIVAVESVTRIPGAPPQVLGVFAHRGEVIPIIDLRLLRTGAAGDASRAVIVRAARGAYALTVTRVFGITPLGGAPERMGDEGLLRHLRGPVRAHDRDVALVDVEGLFEFLKG
jgi:purine-binding chemotaxis protein CheW